MSFLGAIARPAASAAGSGSFAPTGSMGTPRRDAVAAPLPDGRVLVAGGYTGNLTALASAEVFDPARNSFSSAGIGSLGTPRYGAGAAPLPDGRVLVAGGFNGSAVLQSAEVFDPATNGFSSAGIGSLGTPRSGAVAAPLPDGRVLVAGGFNGPLTALASAEVFDPASNSFSSAGIGSMGTPRGDAAAAPLPDGRVLVAGGAAFGSFAVDTAEVFDPASNSFSSAGIGSMGTPRGGAAAAPLPDGRVLVTGGYIHEPVVASAEVFDPATNGFSSAGIGSMGTGRWGAAAAPLPDGRVLVAGGADDPVSAEIFAATNDFSFSLKGRRLVVGVYASGKVAASDAAAPLGASAAKKSRRLRLRPSSGSGDPPRIVVPLRLTKLAKAKLRMKGTVKLKARITFTPLGGLAKTRMAKLKLRSKMKR